MKYTEKGVRALLRKRISEARTMKEWADAHGVSHPYVVQVAGGKEPPGPKIQRALGLTKEVLFEGAFEPGMGPDGPVDG